MDQVPNRRHQVKRIEQPRGLEWSQVRSRIPALTELTLRYVSNNFCAPLARIWVTIYRV